ncbi:MAG TPA: preprotein translocase subunit SecE [Symbiobacteriaceae bacterium]|nr:preprotein translocase subunit SecE [Symbiobacteriaceae bacterium]
MERLKGYIARTRDFFREVVGELSKVVWPTLQRTAKLTGVVLGIVTLVMCYMYILDWPLSLGLGALVNR